MGLKDYWSNVSPHFEGVSSVESKTVFGQNEAPRCYCGASEASDCWLALRTDFSHEFCGAQYLPSQPSRFPADPRFRVQGRGRGSQCCYHWRTPACRCRVGKLQLNSVRW